MPATPIRAMITPHFSEAEMACPCCGWFDPTYVRLLCARLESLRELVGPLTILSGSRCRAHNSERGGARDSMHLLSLAADIQCGIDSMRYRIVNMLQVQDWGGIGVNVAYVHADLRRFHNGGLPSVLWAYPVRG